ncbi:MAG: hypothetical protein V4666_08025 [Bacteroidota bacterium]
MEKVKIILNKTKSHSDRYTLISGSMGSHGEVGNHANRFLEVVNGIDRGAGYRGYTAINYFLTLEYVPQEAKDKVIEYCNKQGYVYN